VKQLGTGQLGDEHRFAGAGIGLYLVRLASASQENGHYDQFPVAEARLAI
jgi:hypothetical protein